MSCLKDSKNFPMDSVDIGKKKSTASSYSFTLEMER